ncbi:MAG: glycosyl hydrolase, partial [Cyclobacteriaceae bacterium]|nr:glycosyl hydrolase [Cyclobacteriaceae bacterium]
PGIGENPMTGVILDYYLPEEADSLDLKLEILNSAGKVVRSYSNKKDENFKPFPGGPSPAPVIPAKKGLNRFAWDFRGATLLEIPNAFVYGDYSGHRLAPGKYVARLTFEGVSTEASIEVVQDPNLKNVSPQDWIAQQYLLEKASTLLTEIHQSVNDMRNVKSQLEHHNSLLKNREDSKELLTSGEELIKKLTDWESKIVETRQSNFQDVINFPSQLNAQFFELKSAIDVHDPRLTDAVKGRLGELEATWNSYQVVLNGLIQKEIPAYNEQYKSKNIPAIIKD